MEIDYTLMSEAVRDGVAAAEKKRPARMMAIRPFDAFNDEGRPVQVVGVYDDDDEVMRFIVIIEDADGDGEIYPIVERTVFREKQAA
ncbi:hypothetical protein IFT66_06890 [Rhizobium sp. CFBP 13726]|uniref:hypothetical protein n=1 Tax=Rhizobium sp. CFBP 13726 TaxID=2775296 RepID=UPI001783C4FC|nr:hypothetical protein [Rhizobium sp. CFBP 13726]MBD8650802.1 hypothetical protein [Rhizobium sp. CFBP 13726]